MNDFYELLRDFLRLSRNISISRLIEENNIPFALESEESFYQLKPEVQEGILWANAHRDELPAFDSLEEMNTFLDTEDEK